MRQLRLLSMTRWPRGKYNGQRIVGMEIRARFDLEQWGFRAKWDLGTCFVHIGPMIVWFDTAYSWRQA